MIAAEKVAVVLLAAGTSSRFGTKDKLAEPLNGVPLGFHAARTLASLPFAARIVVTRDGALDYAAYGFDPVNNPDPGAGQSSSIKLGVEEAHVGAPDAILIVLADMPLVTVVHIEALLARSDEQYPIVASTSGGAPRPPAIFRSSLFEDLKMLDGDRGARHLLQSAILVAAPPESLVDVDTPADFAVVAAESAYLARTL